LSLSFHSVTKTTYKPFQAIADVKMGGMDEGGLEITQNAFAQETWRAA
jgi:hypothetical protein